MALEVLQFGDGPTASSIRNNPRLLNMFGQAGTATLAPAILSFCRNDPRQLYVTVLGTL